MSNTINNKEYLDKNEWEVTRRHSAAKERDNVQVTGKTYTEKYVIENNLIDDFTLTRDMICDILQLSDQVVDTYVMPKLDIAYAGPIIRANINRNKIQVVISKKSLLEFVEQYVDTVQEKQEIYIIKKKKYDDIDLFDESLPELEKMMDTIAVEVYDCFKNKKYIQQFLDFATTYLENNVYCDYKTNLTKDRKKVISMIKESIENDILNGLESYRSIATAKKYKHSMQARRYINRACHYVVKVRPLDPDSRDKKSVIRFVLFPTIYVESDGQNEDNRQIIVNKDDIDTKEFYSLTVKTKTIEYLKAKSKGRYDMRMLVLKSIENNMESIFGAYKIYLEQRKSKEK